MSDAVEWEIDFVSLDVIYLQDSIDLCRKKPGMLVEIPKGNALQKTANQFQCSPTSLSGCLPGELYNAGAFCQRNSLLLAFHSEFSDADRLLVFESSKGAMLDAWYANNLQTKLGINSANLDPTNTAFEFTSLFNAPDMAVQFSPVYVDGYTGHTVIVKNNMWYDSAHPNAKLGNGLDMSTADWHLTLPYKWKLWHCVNVRVLWLKGTHGIPCKCGKLISRAVDARTHSGTKVHLRWLRKTDGKM